MRGGRVVRVWREEDGLPDRFTFSLAYDPQDEALWLGTWSGTALMRRGRIAPLPAELANARPLTMHVDRRGRLWVGLRDGKVLRRERHGAMQVLGQAEGLSDQVVWSIASDEQGVWLGTNGDGALYVSDSGIERWDTARGLVDDFVWQVLSDRQGRVWFFTSQGLDRLDHGRIRHFGMYDGLPDLEGTAGASFEDRRGRLWFGTGSGLVRFEPALETGAPSPPPALLERASFGEGEALRGGMVLPATSPRVSFSLVSLSFRNEKSVRYSYRLLPVQAAWSVPQTEGDIAFAALGPGQYRFEAVAVDAEGRRSSAPVVLPFAVARPWWQRPVVLLAVVVVGMATAVGLARFRIVRLRARAQELEELVRERTRELAQKAMELERIAETDELTGLANRRRFFEVLRAELQRLWRAPAGARLALLLLDLDKFKEINDTFGHAVGDQVLQAVGRGLASAVRGTDTVARIGGDEFAVILPMTDRGGAKVAAYKVLDSVAHTKVTHAGCTLTVHATAGLAVVAPSAAFAESEVTRLLQRADLALYAAKRRGGNVILEDSETWA